MNLACGLWRLLLRARAGNSGAGAMLNVLCELTKIRGNENGSGACWVCFGSSKRWALYLVCAALMLQHEWY